MGILAVLEIYAVTSLLCSTGALLWAVGVHGVPQNWRTAFPIAILAPIYGPPMVVCMFLGYWCFRLFWKLAGGDA